MLLHLDSFTQGFSALEIFGPCEANIKRLRSAKSFWEQDKMCAVCVLLFPRDRNNRVFQVAGQSKESFTKLNDKVWASLHLLS